MANPKLSAEQVRLNEHYKEGKKWLQWGPYLSERQWGTVREDYSPNGTAWDFFPHDHARSRVYRWGEDGIAGISDKFCNMCFAITLWNGKDSILKERLFGLTGPQGNHAEDCKELYYYLDSTPTHSYMKHLYKYPQAAYPYSDLLVTNQNRTKKDPEYEILDTGVFDNSKYFDVFTEYAKANEDDILIRISVHNRSEESAEISVLPTLWFRNLWSFGVMDQKPSLELLEEKTSYGCIAAEHPKLKGYYLYFEKADQTLFTENETNTERLFDIPNPSPFVKDAFNKAVIENDFSVLEGQNKGTKFAPLYQTTIEGNGSFEIRLRLCKEKKKTNPLKKEFENTFEARITEADEFYSQFKPRGGDDDLRNIQRQAFAGMLWTKQYYNIDMEIWLDGDPGQYPPPANRKYGRNKEWRTLNNEDIISMPDKWEYPWYAAWDLAFHCIPLAMLDPDFAKEQLILMLREWYMHPNGQIPAYEWAFSDVNPPVHAWAAIRVFEIDKKKNGKGDIDFLKRVFQKLLLNFTWWVNRKDHNNNNVFEGGFLGLDNIGVFDRSSTIPGGGHLEQADGTAWMAMFSLNMLEIAMEIACVDPSFEDVTTKFFEHFIYIAESLNNISEDWTGSWDEEEGFFYDILALPGSRYIPLKVRSLVGLTTLFAVWDIDTSKLEKLADFKMRMKWFRNYRIKNNKSLVVEDFHDGKDILLSLIPQKRLKHILAALLNEQEFLSPGGIRSLSKVHETPYVINIEGQHFGLKYEPAESSTRLFGGNSNWRGPVWMPMNYMIIQSLKRYYQSLDENFEVEFPTGSGEFHDLRQVSQDISDRLISIFTKDKDGKRPVHGHYDIYHKDPHFQDLILFYEYFHGDNARGVGASHQLGWTGLIAELIDEEDW